MKSISRLRRVKRRESVDEPAQTYRIKKLRRMAQEAGEAAASPPQLTEIHQFYASCSW
jgi:hypothetical protein